jgi:hypothetical protein
MRLFRTDSTEATTKLFSALHDRWTSAYLLVDYFVNGKDDAGCNMITNINYEPVSASEYRNKPPKIDENFTHAVSRCDDQLRNHTKKRLRIHRLKLLFAICELSFLI